MGRLNPRMRMGGRRGLNQVLRNYRTWARVHRIGLARTRRRFRGRRGAYLHQIRRRMAARTILYGMMTRRAQYGRHVRDLKNRSALGKHIRTPVSPGGASAAGPQALTPREKAPRPNKRFRGARSDL